MEQLPFPVFGSSVHISLTPSNTMLQWRSNAFTLPKSFLLFLRTIGFNKNTSFFTCSWSKLECCSWQSQWGPWGALWRTNVNKYSCQRSSNLWRTPPAPWPHAPPVSCLLCWPSWSVTLSATKEVLLHVLKVIEFWQYTSTVRGTEGLNWLLLKTRCQHCNTDSAVC